MEYKLKYGVKFNQPVLTSNDHFGVLIGAVLTGKNRQLKPGAVDWCQPCIV